ncbi:hypothetical protein SAMN05428995_1018 [Loktanella sp. DSM 29012]|nr:hypothetical protein SAMN05428995_1018 [Loktanella sp. DSM 29012]
MQDGALDGTEAETLTDWTAEKFERLKAGRAGS